MKARKTLFISHAQPEDNAFAKWLYFKLMLAGFDVWCELTCLRPGEYFWDKIDSKIRTETVKFLFVASQATAIKRNGIYDEFDFARTIATDYNLDRFIYILKIDDAAANSRIGQHRINSIDFEKSWAKGLKDLLAELEKDNVPINPEQINSLTSIWKAKFNSEDKLIEKNEEYISNWFPIVSMPITLNFHRYDELISATTPLWKFKYPAKRYREYIATFADCYDFIEEFPSTGTYKIENSVHLNVQDILSNAGDHSFISNSDAKIIVQSLLNKAFNLAFKNYGMRRYKMASNRHAHWFEAGTLEKEKANGTLMIGKMKQGKDKHINWHFAFSGASKLGAVNIFVIKSHIIFTEDGKKIVNSPALQHKARRKQGRNWWNKHWKDKLLNSLFPFADENNLIEFKVGEQSKFHCSSRPMKFLSPVTYIDPGDDYLPDEEVFETEVSEEEHLDSINEETDNHDDDA